MRQCKACMVTWALTQPVECWVCGVRGQITTFGNDACIVRWQNPATWTAATAFAESETPVVVGRAFW